MIVYHGTSFAHALDIDRLGILPRRVLGEELGNWENAVVSHPGMVYLTDCYAPFFAMVASGDLNMAIVEVDLDRIDPSMLRPDEDFIEQACRTNGSARGIILGMLGEDESALPRGLETRTGWFRDRIDALADLWQASLTHLGSCAVADVVPVDAITGIVTIDPAATTVLRAVDPSITLFNHSVMGSFYRELTRWFFDPSARPSSPLCPFLTEDVLARREGLTRIR